MDFGRYHTPRWMSNFHSWRCTLKPQKSLRVPTTANTTQRWLTLENVILRILPSPIESMSAKSLSTQCFMIGWIPRHQNLWVRHMCVCRASNSKSHLDQKWVYLSSFFFWFSFSHSLSFCSLFLLFLYSLSYNGKISPLDQFISTHMCFFWQFPKEHIRFYCSLKPADGHDGDCPL